MNTVIEQINSMGRAFVDFMWPMLWQSSVLIAILLALDFMLRRKVRAVFRYWLWMLVLIKLVLPTTLSSPVSVGQLVGEPMAAIKISAIEQSVLSETEQPVGRDISNTATNPSRSAEISETSKASSPVTPTNSKPITPAVSVEWQGAVFMVWLAIAAAMILLLLQRAMFVCGLVRQANEANDLMKDMLGFCRKTMDVRGQVGLKGSPNATSPAVCGLLRPVILLPHGIGTNLGSSGLRVVLMHELAHIKRGDLWVNLLQTLLQIAYFYNPLLWLANWVIRRVREQAVDEAVQVALGEKAQQYPETLLNVARLAFERPALSLRLIGVVESKGALTGRIKRMLNRPIPKTAKLGIIGSTTLILLAAVLLPMAKGMAKKPMPEFVIKGNVTDTVTGKPIAGAKVGDAERYARGKYSAVTDSNGNYSYKTWYEEHNVKCEASGYKAETKVLLTKVLGSEQEAVLDFALNSKRTGEDGFKVMLSNDMTVELVAICDYPDGKPRSWRPDGSKLEKQIYIKREGVYQEGKYGFIMRFDMPIDSSVELQRMGRWYHSCTVMDSGVEKKGFSPDITWENNKPRRKGYRASITNEYDGGEITNVRARIATGQWNTAAVSDGRGTDMKPDSGFVFSKAYEADGSVNIAVSGKWQEDQQQQIVAIDNNGGSYATRIEPGGNARFDNWKLSQIKEFRVRTRPYQWVEFKNVSLRPGGKTDVQVEVEKKKRAFWEENAVSYSWAPVKEGVGLDCFIIGDAKCTGEFIKSKLGEPEKEKKDEKEGWWLVYHKKYGLDFWLNLQENTLYEIRLNKGFTGKLTSGISMFSTKQDVFKTYGEPIRETAADNLTNLFDDRVLFVGKDGISKINYKEKGVLFWFDGDKINQIRVGAVSSASNIDVAVEDFNIIPYPEGGLYTVTVSIRNKGGAESPKFGVNFYRGNPKPMTHEAGPIKPGDVWYEGSMPFALNEGTNEFVVVLDPDGAIGETDRTNNEASMKVTVKDGKIVEKKVSLSSAKSISKETKGVSAQIINAAEFGDTNGANAGKDNRMSRPEQTGAPVVVKTSPKTLANDVSADLNQITVTFNQQMTDKSWSWVRMDIRYPETTGSPYYDNEKKTCALPVKLEAGKAYLVAFNIEPYLGFVNSKGAPAKPYVLVFATKDKDGKPTPIPEELIVKAKSINDLLQEMSPEAKGEENKAGSVPYTQIIYDDIQPDGTIAFKNPIREMNKSGRTITTNNFINSDFVQVTGMRDADGNDLKLTSIHDGSIYRYEVTFNKPIPPGELIEYTSEGTMKGLIKPVAGSEGVFQYYMRHSPAAGEPTQRIETYLLPAGAELISTTPEDMERRTKDGRIELHVEKMIPIGGSITTSFRYRMP